MTREFIIILILTGFFIISYMIGRIINNRRLKRIWPTIKGELDKYCRDYRITPLGSSGIRVYCTKTVDNLRRTQFSIVLMDRENVIHYLIQRLAKGYDRIIFQCNFRRKPGLRLEIISLEEKKVLGALEAAKLKKLKPKWLHESFMIYTNRVKKALQILDRVKGDVIKSFDALRWISISEEQPHFHGLAELNSQDPLMLAKMADVFSRAFSEF